jgi:hypothetical protein
METLAIQYRFQVQDHRTGEWDDEIGEWDTAEEVNRARADFERFAFGGGLKTRLVEIVHRVVGD